MAELAQSPKRAEKAARDALRKAPSSADLLFVSGLVALRLEKLRDARNFFIRAVNTKQAAAAAYLNAALAEFSLGKHEAAFRLLKAGEARFPADTELATTTIKLLVQSGQGEVALARAEAALAAFPAAPGFHALAGLAAESAGNLPQALAHLTAAANEQENTQTLLDLSRVQTFANLDEAARASARRAVALEPANPAARFNLAWRETEAGDFPAARTAFAATLSSPPHAFEALRMLAQITDPAGLPALEAEADRLKPQAKSDEQRGELALARYHILRKSDWESALGALIEANRHYAKFRHYDNRADTAWHARILEAFDASQPAARPDHSPTPIFITGMIRTGTTLLDRLLSAAPDVASMGEVAAADRFFRNALPETGSPNLSAFASRYSAYQALVGPARFTIDKMPVNYMYLGWLARTFPNAKLILMERDFRDVAASAFTGYFNADPMNFTFREDWLIEKHALYLSQVALWEARGVSFLRVAYEDLVSHPRETLDGIAGFCGLPPIPDAAPSSGGAIRTASFAQARSRIDTASIGNWQKFQRALPTICKP